MSADHVYPAERYYGAPEQDGYDCAYCRGTGIDVDDGRLCHCRWVQCDYCEAHVRRDEAARVGVLALCPACFAVWMAEQNDAAAS